MREYLLLFNIFWVNKLKAESSQSLGKSHKYALEDICASRRILPSQPTYLILSLYTTVIILSSLSFAICIQYTCFSFLFRNRNNALMPLFLDILKALLIPLVKFSAFIITDFPPISIYFQAFKSFLFRIKPNAVHKIRLQWFAKKEKQGRSGYESYRNRSQDRRPRARCHPQGNQKNPAYPRGRPVTDNIDTVAEFLRKYRQVCWKAGIGLVHIDGEKLIHSGYLRRVKIGSVHFLLRRACFRCIFCSCKKYSLHFPY